MLIKGLPIDKAVLIRVADDIGPLYLYPANSYNGTITDSDIENFGDRWKLVIIDGWNGGYPSYDDPTGNELNGSAEGDKMNKVIQELIKQRDKLDKQKVKKKESGIKTTIPFHRQLMDHPDYIKGEYTTKFMESFEMNR